MYQPATTFRPCYKQRVRIVRYHWPSFNRPWERRSALPFSSDRTGNLKPTLMERRGIIAINLIEAWDHPGMTQNHWGESRLGRREHPRACTRVRNFGFEVGILVRLSLGLHAESGNETRIMLQRLSVLVQRCPDRLWRLRQQAIISQSVHLCNAGLLKHSQASILRLGS